MRRRLERLEAVSAREDTCDDARACTMPAEQVVCCIADDSDVPHVLDPQPDHGGKNEVGSRSAAKDAGRAKCGVDERIPAEGGQQQITSLRGEAGRDRDLDGARAKSPECVVCALKRDRLTVFYAARVRLLERVVGRLGPIFVPQHLPKDGDLATAHGLADGFHEGLVWFAVVEVPDGAESVEERTLDRPIVAHEGAGEVDGCELDHDPERAYGRM